MILGIRHNSKKKVKKAEIVKKLYKLYTFDEASYSYVNVGCKTIY